MAGDATESDLIDVVVRLPRATVEQSLQRKGDAAGAISAAKRSALAQAILTSRSRRRKLFRGLSFGEPCWDMILELYVATGQRRTINITGLCSACGRSTTTGLRNLEALEARGYVRREADKADTRATLVIMQPALRQAVDDWLDLLSELAGGIER